ncbi:hypothetical protein [Flavobacterium tyrosinilyticum]|uniref:hypothetical protein n=1 Tax=Flavobacterium tyrosinilyticum TaxID=1658740 RepID=UPI00202E299D|nr:hypothetical protein [Flavobacterium tyrosinilyticum]MCM0667355.1 hypothetical protein [Flavobacterium tyrosinilyticum]
MSCSEHEETPIYTKGISFVHADGTKLSENECISPNVKYGIRIETNFVDINRPFIVDYSVNGTVYTMTFTTSTSLTNPVVLANGNNTAQIIGSNYKAVLKYVDQGDYELVE